MVTEYFSVVLMALEQELQLRQRAQTSWWGIVREVELGLHLIQSSRNISLVEYA